MLFLNSRRNKTARDRICRGPSPSQAIGVVPKKRGCQVLFPPELPPPPANCNWRKGSNSSRKTRVFAFGSSIWRRGSEIYLHVNFVRTGQIRPALSRSAPNPDNRRESSHFGKAP